MSIDRQPVASCAKGDPDHAENRCLCRARALSKRGAFVARGRERRCPVGTVYPLSEASPDILGRKDSIEGE